MINSKLKIFPGNKLIIIILTSFLCSFFFIINSGLFWDDWTLYNAPSESINKMFKMSGIPIFGYFHNSILWIAEPILIYKLLAFVSYFIIFILFIRCLLKLDFLTSRDAYLIGIIAISLPFNFVKHILIILPYGISLLLFFIALYLVIHGLINKWYFRILSLTLFLISFTTNSLLVFYLIVPIFIIYQIFKEKRSIRINKIVFIENFRYLDFYLLQVLFWVLNKTLFPVTGIYASRNYNAITLGGIIKLPLTFMEALDRSFFELFGLFTIFEFIISLFLFIIVLVLIRLIPGLNSNKGFNGPKESVYSGKKLILLGLLLVFLAILPYALVNKIPAFNDYESRNQLLLPFGTAILIYYLIKKLIKERFQIVFTLFIVSMFISITISLQYLMLFDHYKQVAIINELKENPKLIESYKTLIVVDESTKYFEERKVYYAFTGLYKRATGKQDKLLILQSDFDRIGIEGFNERMQLKEALNLKDYTLSNPDGKLIISDGKAILSKKFVFKLFLTEKLNKEKFHELIKDVIKINSYGIDN